MLPLDGSRLLNSLWSSSHVSAIKARITTVAKVHDSTVHRKNNPAHVRLLVADKLSLSAQNAWHIIISNESSLWLE